MEKDLSQEGLGIVGRSPQIAEIFETIRQVADTDITVLLIGESGVGKEVFARAIHRLSRRADQRLITINCAAIPEALLESELFGHERGAFTGAVETRKGLFEAADHGTIFLDEIGEMSLATQAKLLRILETFEFTRVGSTDTRKTDVRVIAATNRDLQRESERGSFRRDLYYRLASVQLRIPPLRDRWIDIPALADSFGAQVAANLKAPYRGFTPEAMRLMIEYSWPGNIRELKNFVELVITLERGEQIDATTVRKYLDVDRHAPVENPGAIVHVAGRTPEQAERELIYRALIELRNEVADLKRIVTGGAPGGPMPMSAPSPMEAPVPSRAALPAPQTSLDTVLERLDDFSLETMERKMILAALKRYGGNRRLAALALGISERTLYRKLNEEE